MLSGRRGASRRRTDGPRGPALGESGGAAGRGPTSRGSFGAVALRDGAPTSRSYKPALQARGKVADALAHPARKRRPDRSEAGPNLLARRAGLENAQHEPQPVPVTVREGGIVVLHGRPHSRCKLSARVVQVVLPAVPAEGWPELGPVGSQRLGVRADLVRNGILELGRMCSERRPRLRWAAWPAPHRAPAPFKIARAEKLRQPATRVLLSPRMGQPQSFGRSGKPGSPSSGEVARSGVVPIAMRVVLRKREEKRTHPAALLLPDRGANARAPTPTRRAATARRGMRGEGLEPSRPLRAGGF